MNIWSFCIRRPVFTLVLTIAILAFGLIGYFRLGVDQYPKIEPPIVTITTTFAGANPEVMDQDVTDVIESEVGTLEGVDTITSSSAESRSQVTVTFVLGRDIDTAAQEVRDRVATARKSLPADIDPPLVEKIDPAAQPIMWLAVNGDGPYRELSRLVDNEIKTSLQSLPGVGGLQLGGFRRQAVRVWLDASRMAAYKVTPTDVTEALARWQNEIPGGRVENDIQEASIKIEGEFKTVSQLNQLVVRYQSGSIIRLRDIASVQMGLDDNRGLARFNQKQAIGIGVRKQSGGNTVATADAVKKALPEIRSRLPAWVNIDIASDASRFIKATVEGVTHDVLFGAAITCIVIGFFLRSVRTTLISVLAIPTSLIGTFYLLYVSGFTLNQMTLLGMSLSVGLVVDDAIVVIENIHRHIEEEGLSPREAAEVGTGEVAFAVLAATTSILVIFLPVGFMSGIVGQFFGSFGLTVVLTMLISLLVSWTLTPMLAARFMTKETGEGAFARFLAKPVDWLEAMYRVTLGPSIKTLWGRLLTIALGIAFFAFGIVIASRLGSEFIPDSDDSRFLVLFETPTGSSLELTEERMKRAETMLFGHPEIQGAFSAIGLISGQPNSGLFFVTMKPPKERTKSQQTILDELRKEFATVAGFKSFMASLDPLRMGALGSKSGAVSYVLQGPDLQELERLSDGITQKLRSDGAFVDVDSDLRLTRPELRILPDRDAAANLGLDVRSISLAIQTFFGGVDAAKFTDRGKRYDIRVRGEADQRNHANDLQRISVRSRSGELFRLSQVVKVEEGVGPNSINRYNRQRSTSITTNLNGIPAGEGGERFLQIARGVIGANKDYSLVAAGQSKMMMESFQYLIFAMALSIFVVYLVLAAQFESFIHPFTVMMTLPLTTTGVFAALYLTGSTINVYSFIGMIMLVGIVTRNAILLIDRMNQNRSRGMLALEAALEAGPVRLKPILMTTVSAVVGLIPVAIGASEGGEARAPMGIAVIGGLLASTTLTLYVIPAVYLLIESGLDRIGRKSRAESSSLP